MDCVLSSEHDRLHSPNHYQVTALLYHCLWTDVHPCRVAKRTCDRGVSIVGKELGKPSPLL